MEYEAPDSVNSLLNYEYAILESMVRKDINKIVLDVQIFIFMKWHPQGIL